jgi:ABC-type transport system involved in multi-copper enzyme maturation permease subunit
MNGPAVLYMLRCLIQATFRQAMSTRIFWIMLGVSGLCIFFCLSVSVEGGLAPRHADDTELYTRQNEPLTSSTQIEGSLSLLFGLVDVPLFRDRESAVHFLQVLLATWVAGTVGLLLTLLWTAGFIPEFVQPSSAAVLFAKPVPRWLLLVGKYLGVLVFVTFQAAVFFVGTWLALSLKTGIWLYPYLLALPLLVFHFAVIYSFAVLLGVWTRSTVASVFGSILFWLVCFGMNYGHHAAAALPELNPGAAPLSSVTGVLVNAGYWILPKPADLIAALETVLEARRHFTTLADLPEFRLAWQQGQYHLELVFLTALLFTLVMLGLAGYQLQKTDY